MTGVKRRNATNSAQTLAEHDIDDKPEECQRINYLSENPQVAMDNVLDENVDKVEVWYNARGGGLNSVTVSDTELRRSNGEVNGIEGTPDSSRKADSYVIGPNALWSGSNNWQRRPIGGILCLDVYTG